MPAFAKIAVFSFCVLVGFASSALALSTLEPLGPPIPPAMTSPQNPKETLVPEGGEVVKEPLGPIETIPLPLPVPGMSGAEANPDITGPTATPPAGAANSISPAISDLATLPAAAARMREMLLEAAKTGDIEKLRPLLGVGEEATQISVTDIDGDVIDYLKGQAGDAQGQEILAIMLDLLEGKFVHNDIGTAEELYVWPYFVERQLDKLTPPERVDLFRIVTAGDYEDMKAFGAYNFYRIGISPEGRFVFFVSGD